MGVQNRQNNRDFALSRVVSFLQEQRVGSLYSDEQLLCSWIYLNIRADFSLLSISIRYIPVDYHACVKVIISYLVMIITKCNVGYHAILS